MGMSRSSPGWALMLFLACLAAYRVSCPDPDPAPEVLRQIQEWDQVSEPVRRFQEIGWNDSFETGRRLAEETGRPLFLLTASGRIDRGRC